MEIETNNKNIRKKREWINFIINLVGSGAAFYYIDYMLPFSLVLHPIGMYLCYECVRSIVTYDVTKWENAKLCIWLGGNFGIVGSSIIYLYLKNKNIGGHND